MNRKIPPDAFDFYVSLGVGRSYQAVASQFKVSKSSVVNAAKREDWQSRLQEIEAKARRASKEKAVESLQAVTNRHLGAMRAIQGKALEALQTMKLDTAMDAVRALNLGVKGERLILGEPTERSAVNVEELIRNEHERWTKLIEDENDGEAA